MAELARVFYLRLRNPAAYPNPFMTPERLHRFYALTGTEITPQTHASLIAAADRIAAEYGAKYIAKLDYFRFLQENAICAYPEENDVTRFLVPESLLYKKPGLGLRQHYTSLPKTRTRNDALLALVNSSVELSGNPEFLQYLVSEIQSWENLSESSERLRISVICDRLLWGMRSRLKDFGNPIDLDGLNRFRAFVKPSWKSFLDDEKIGYATRSEDERISGLRGFLALDFEGDLKATPETQELADRYGFLIGTNQESFRTDWYCADLARLVRLSKELDKPEKFEEWVGVAWVGAVKHGLGYPSIYPDKLRKAAETYALALDVKVSVGDLSKPEAPPPVDLTKFQQTDENSLFW